MEYEPDDGTWIVLPQAREVCEDVRAAIGDERYEQTKLALKEALCEYFSNGDCLGKHGAMIHPVAGSVVAGAKCFKVRWAYPGCGKSGGLRLAYVVYCKERIVKLAGAWMRRDATNAEFDDALKRG